MKPLPAPKVEKTESDAEILDQIARAFGHDAAVQACVAECRAALEAPLPERMALAKKLSFACNTAPEFAPVPSQLTLAMSQLVH